MWEGLWRQSERGTPGWNLYRGLVQNAGAQIKVHALNRSGAAALSRKSRDRLRSVSASVAETRSMGVDVGGLMREVERYYGPLWMPDAELNVRGRPPRLDLS